jgi:hypothetical protein
MPSRSSRRTTGILPLMLGLGIAGCGGGTEPRIPTMAALSASMVTLAAIGQTAQLTATVTDQNGNAIGSPALTWTSANPAVVTVSAFSARSAAGRWSS